MRLTVRTVLTVAGLSAVLMGSAMADTAADNQAAFNKRDGFMKEMSRNFYRGVGRVAKGTEPLTPETVTAAQQVNKFADEMNPSLFPPGSNTEKSKMNPDMPGNPADIAALAAGLQKTTPLLVAAVQTGDIAKIAAAYKVTNDSCEACHTKYRNK